MRTLYAVHAEAYIRTRSSVAMGNSNTHSAQIPPDLSTASNANERILKQCNR